jgi:RimJ/RimL family protein N-acetyltransferase
MDLLDAWPLFGLRLRTPRLELRPVRDEDVPGLVDAALAGIHDPAVMPFAVPWTDAEPDVLRRELARFVWRQRASIRPDTWTLQLAVLHEGRPVGVQDLSTADFAELRTVLTGSWLTRRAQGRGIGTEMRAAVLLFAFDVLGAEVAESSAASWNAASLGVSRRLGYVDNGVERRAPRPGRVIEEQRLRLPRESFVRPAWSLRVEGVEAARRDLLLP